MGNLFHEKSNEELIRLHKALIQFKDNWDDPDPNNEFAKEIVVLKPKLNDSYDWSDIGFELEVEIANRWEKMVGISDTEL